MVPVVVEPAEDENNGYDNKDYDKGRRSGAFSVGVGFILAGGEFYYGISGSINTAVIIVLFEVRNHLMLDDIPGIAISDEMFEAVTGLNIGFATFGAGFGLYQDYTAVVILF